MHIPRKMDMHNVLCISLTENKHTSRLTWQRLVLISKHLLSSYTLSLAFWCFLIRWLTHYALFPLPITSFNFCPLFACSMNKQHFFWICCFDMNVWKVTNLEDMFPSSCLTLFGFTQDHSVFIHYFTSLGSRAAVKGGLSTLSLFQPSQKYKITDGFIWKVS